jgi:hypothetical protein
MESGFIELQRTRQTVLVIQPCEINDCLLKDYPSNMGDFD